MDLSYLIFNKETHEYICTYNNAETLKTLDNDRCYFKELIEEKTAYVKPHFQENNREARKVDTKRSTSSNSTNSISSYHSPNYYNHSYYSNSSSNCSSDSGSSYSDSNSSCDSGSY